MCIGPTSIEGLESWPNRHERARHHMRSLLGRTRVAKVAAVAKNRRQAGKGPSDSKLSGTL